MRAEDYVAGGQPTARGLETNFVKLLLRPAELKGLALRHRAGRDRIYEVIASR